MAIEWNQAEMSTGMQQVDEEHQEWIRRFNEFDAAVIAGHGLESVQQTLEFMANYAENHFIHEETLTDNPRSEAAQLNESEHERFREKIAYLRKWIGQDGASSVEVVSVSKEMTLALFNALTRSASFSSVSTMLTWRLVAVFGA